MLAELDAQQVAEVLPLLRAHTLPPHVAVIPEAEPTSLYTNDLLDEALG